MGVKRKGAEAVWGAAKKGAAAAVGFGAATQSEDADAGVITKGGKRVLEAFHGSPHKFDKFSMDNIGTGEGAQAYGHGLYFADSEDVARGYREGLQYKAFDLTEQAKERGIPLTAGARGELIRQIRANPDSPASDVVRRLKYASRSSRDIDESALTQLVDDYRKADGALYRTHIDVDPDTLLDWDRPVSDEALLRIAESDIAAGRFDGSVEEAVDLMKEYGADTSGARLYAGMVEQTGSGSTAAAALKEAGIPGIRYLDGNSRSAGEGSYNYVMFDDAPISIQERGFATPEALAATAAATFAQMRQEKQGRWAQMREDLVNTMANVAEFTFDTLELPIRGYAGLSAVGGSLAAGEGLQNALMHGANDARSYEQATASMGGAVTDQAAKYVSPEAAAAAGAAVYTGLNAFAPGF